MAFKRYRNKRPLMKDVIIPTAKGATFMLVPIASFASRRSAPNMAGTESTNENLNAHSRFKPLKSEPESVNPDLDMPGITATP
jgi:hypothetical protein